MRVFSFLLLLLCMITDVSAQVIFERGKLYSIRSYARGSYLYQKTDGTPYLYYDGSDCESPNAVWEFVETGNYGIYNVRNVYTGMCISIKNNQLTDRSNDYVNLEVTYNNDNCTVWEAPFIRMANTVDCLSTIENNGIISFWGSTMDHNRFYVEEVQTVSHQLAVGASGWATLILGFNSLIPVDENLRAYIVSSIDDGRLKLKEVTGVLAANTPVLINAPEGRYHFAYTKENATVNSETSFLKGTLYDKDIIPTGSAYVLSMVEGDVCFCKALLNRQNKRAFKNNANKAYLDIPSAYLNSNIRLDFSDVVTSLSQIERGVTDDCIYDLRGRKLDEVTTPGLYIINNKKVLIK